MFQMIDEGLKLWGSILHYIFINHTIRPGHAGPPYPLQETPPAGSVPFGGEFSASHHIPLEHVTKPGDNAQQEPLLLEQ